MSGILVGVDGSGHSQRALEWAAREAALRHTSLNVLTVQQAVRGFWGGTLDYGEDRSLVDKARDMAQAETDQVLAGLGDSRPASVTVKAVHGYPAEALINASADADLVVLGRHGTSGFSRSVLGSVSTQVIHHAHCPVLVLPPEAAN